MRLDIYFLNNWNGYNSPEDWIYCIKRHLPISGLIIGIHGFSHAPRDTTYRIVLFGFGIGINVKTKQ